MRSDVLARHALAAAAALSALFWTAFFLLLQPRYATNDDPLIAMLASGTGFATTPDEHLIFTNVLVGQALKRLYLADPARPWYALYLLATHVLAVTALGYGALRASPRASRVALLAVYLAVAAVPFANNLHFTVAGFAAAQSGLLLAIGLAGRGEGQRRGTVVASVALAVLGSLIRFEAFVLALALAVPAAVIVLRGAPSRAAWRAVLALAVGALFAGGARALDSVHYARAPEWAAYRTFNRTLAEFVDFERANEYTPQTAAAFRAVGWSRNDHRLLMHWFDPDADVFSTANLQHVLAQPLPPATSAGQRLGSGLRRVMDNRPARPILLALPLALLACGATRQGRWAVLAAVITSAAVLVHLIVFRKAPPHVYLPVLAWPLALATVLPASSMASRTGRVAQGAAAVAAAVASVWALAFQRAESAEGRTRERSWVQAVEPLRAAPDRTYVLWSTFPYHVGDPLRAPAALPAARFVALGWPARTPAARATLAALGHADVVSALGDPRARLLAPPETAVWVEQYARRHRGRDLVLVPEGAVPGLAVFRAAPAAGEAAERVLRSEPAVPE
jgi:hypothetical protein